jgi:hypothetical protein
MTTIVIPAQLDAGPDFIIGETLTLFEAAMVYTDRHPHGAFLRDASNEDHEKFLGKGRLEKDVRAQLSWVVYCHLVREAEAGKLVLAREAYLNGGRHLDPRHTRIPIGVLLDLARKRGDGGSYIRALLAVQQDQLRAGSAAARQANCAAELQVVDGPSSATPRSNPRRDASVNRLARINDALIVLQTERRTFRTTKELHHAVLKQCAITDNPLARGWHYKTFCRLISNSATASQILMRP